MLVLGPNIIYFLSQSMHVEMIWEVPVWKLDGELLCLLKVWDVAQGYHAFADKPNGVQRHPDSVPAHPQITVIGKF